MKRFLISLMLAISAFALPVAVDARPDTDNTVETTMSEDDILKLCKWYVATLPSDDPKQQDLRQQVAAQIVMYAIDTDKFVLSMGGEIFLVRGGAGKNPNPDLLGVYLAGEIIYCLENKLPQSNAASFVSAMQGVMSQYSLMPEHKTKTLNKYLKMSKAERAAAFEKYYNKNHQKGKF